MCVYAEQLTLWRVFLSEFRFDRERVRASWTTHLGYFVWTQPHSLRVKTEESISKGRGPRQRDFEMRCRYEFKKRLSRSGKSGGSSVVQTRERVSLSLSLSLSLSNGERAQSVFAHALHHSDARGGRTRRGGPASRDTSGALVARRASQTRFPRRVFFSLSLSLSRRLRVPL